MILKASQRGGGRQLAAHLQNEQENDRFEIAQVRGTVAQDLHGAFAEWEVHASGTKCRKYIYSLSINPDARQRELSREEYFEMAARVEKSLGLQEQARAVVFHWKKGRMHAHVAWSRIDVEKMRAIQLSHDRRKIRDVTREFARDKSLTLPEGLQKKPDREKKRRNRHSNLAEQQQEERSGIAKRERMAAFEAAWFFSFDTAGFRRSIERQGYVFARGRKGRLVAVDHAGEIHSVARQLPGIDRKELKERLGPIEQSLLPAASAVQMRIRDRDAHAFTAAFNRTNDGRCAALAKDHARRRAAMKKREDALQERHKRQMEKIRAAHAAYNAARADDRKQRKYTGLAAFLRRVTGIDMLQAARHALDDMRLRKAQQRQIDALGRIHARESREIQRNMTALARVEKRELRSLETALRRERLAAQIERGRQGRRRDEDGRRAVPPGKAIAGPELPLPPVPEKTREMKEAGRDIFSRKLIERLKDKQSKKTDRDRDTGRGRDRDRGR